MLLPLVGVLSFLLAFKVLNSAKTTFARVLYWAVFIFLGIPLSLIGSVGGGLLGPIGSIVFGVVPVFVVLYLAKGVLTLLRK